jgi:hypothetical protein
VEPAARKRFRRNSCSRLRLPHTGGGGNLSWYAVERDGQRQAGDWTDADNRRLTALVDHAHKLGYWIRFYTLDGFAAADNRGMCSASYNFGFARRGALRWKAALEPA